MSESVSWLRAITESIDRWISDRQYRQTHNDPSQVTPTSTPRLVLLTDTPYRTYVGSRAWCDGSRRHCELCWGRCCRCRHDEFGA